MESKRLRTSGRRAERQENSCNLARPHCQPMVEFWLWQIAGEGLDYTSSDGVLDEVAAELFLSFGVNRR